MTCQELVPVIEILTPEEEYQMLKDKIKARYNEIMSDPFSRGMVIGTGIGITSVVLACKMIQPNFDPKNLYIPEPVLEKMRSTAEQTVIATNGKNIVLLSLLSDLDS